MAEDILDDATKVTCGLCDGEGIVTTRQEKGSIYRVACADCWLCDGVGMVTVMTFETWVRGGRPIEKPEGW